MTLTTVRALVALSMVPLAAACRSYDCARVNESAEVLRGVPVPVEHTGGLPGLEMDEGESVYSQHYTLQPDGEFRFERTVQKEVALLGVDAQVIDAGKAAKLGVEAFSAIYVERIASGSPAGAAGILKEDAILALDGERVLSRDHLQHLIERNAPGSTVVVDVLRAGEARKLQATLGSSRRYTSKEDLRRTLEVVDDRKRTGLRLASLPPDLRSIVLGTPADRPGLLVTEVVPGSPAFWSDLRVGDLVLRAGGTPIETAEDYTATLSVRPEGDPVTYEVLREGSERSLRLTLSEDALGESGFSIPIVIHCSSKPAGTDFELLLGMLFNFSSCRGVRKAKPGLSRRQTSLAWGLALDLISYRGHSDGETRLTLLWFIPLWWSSSARLES